MNTYLKKIISLLLVSLCIFNQMPNQMTQAAQTLPIDKASDKVVTYGSYLGKPLVWDAGDIYKGQMALHSRFIIDFKPFDAAESGIYKVGETEDQRRGSDDLLSSNLMEWLNSPDIEVKYSTTPPTKAAVYADPYANEPGFLSGFTSLELQALMTDENNLYANISHGQYYFGAGYRVPSLEAVKRKESGGATINDSSPYWVNNRRMETPGDSHIYVLSSSSTGGSYTSFPCTQSCGVLPLMTLKTENLTIVGGDGSNGNPYQLKVKGDTESNTVLYETYAEKLSTLGIFKGTQGGFELERQPNRMEGMIMLIRLLGKETEALAYADRPCPFDDVEPWAQGYATYAYDQGLSNGVSPGKFGSTAPMTSQTYMTFLLRALGYDDQMGDFTWDKALEKAFEVGLLNDYTYYEITNLPFNRDQVALYSYTVLNQKIKDKAMSLKEMLIDQGVFEEESLLKIFK